MSRSLTLKLELDTSPLLQKLKETTEKIRLQMAETQENVRKSAEKSAGSITVPEPEAVAKEPGKVEESAKKETAKKKKEKSEPFSFQGLAKDAQKDFQELSRTFSQSMAVAFHRMKKSGNLGEMFASGKSAMEQMFSKIKTSDAVTKFSENGKKRWKEAAEMGKTAFTDFFTQISKANSFKTITASVLNLGGKGFSALVKLAGPWGLITAGAAAAFAAIVKLTAQFSKLEDAARKASNAFRMGGRMEGVGMAGFQRQARAMSADGSLNYQDMLQGMGNLRKSGFSLDTKTFEEVTKAAKDGASFLGGSYSQTLEQLGGILHATEVSYDELVNAGLAFTAAEYRQIEALKGVHNQTARNQIILAKMKETYKGASKEEANTVSGMMGTFKNHLQGIMEDVGTVLAPIVKLVMGIVNPLLQAGRMLLAPFVAFGKILGTVVDGINRIRDAMLEPILGALQRLRESYLNLAQTITDNPWWEMIVSAFATLGRIVGWFVSLVIDGFAGILNTVEFLIRPLMRLGGLFVNVGKKFSDYIGGAITSGVKAAEGFFDKIVGKFQEFWGKIKDNPIIKLLTRAASGIGRAGLMAFDMLFGKSENADEQAKKEAGYIDPRARMNVNFEDSTSMNQRIQKSLLERNSPAVKQVNLLEALNSKVEVLVGQSEKANGQRKEHKDLTQKELRAIQEFAPGLG